MAILKKGLVRRCDYIREYDRGCRNSARWQFLTAPEGTAHPQRARVYLCTRHYNMWRNGTLDTLYIEVGQAEALGQ